LKELAVLPDDSGRDRIAWWGSKRKCCGRSRPGLETPPSSQPAREEAAAKMPDPFVRPVWSDEKSALTKNRQDKPPPGEAWSQERHHWLQSRSASPLPAAAHAVWAG